MNRKQLAEMIKHLRKQKMKEQIGGMGKFKGGSADIQDLSGPNRPINQAAREQHHEEKLEEVAGPERKTRASLGPNRSRALNVYKRTLGKLENRRWGGNQSQRGRYTIEGEVDLGSTETNRKSETVDVSPKDSTLMSKMGKLNNTNTVTKENKEK